MSDLIDRQAMLKNIEKIRYGVQILDDTHRADIIMYGMYLCEKAVRNQPSVQLEQTGCEYCHEDSDGYVKPIEKNSHAWLIRRGRTTKLRIGFKGEYRECDILFCPMCGRRLT